MESTGIVPTMPVGGNSMFGGEGIWIFALLILLFGSNGGFGFCGNRNGIPSNVATTQDVTYTSAFNQLQDENSNIISTIGNTRNDIITAIKDSAYANLTESRDIEAAVNAGFARQSECCCNTLRAIDGVNYNSAINTAAINANTTAQTQKILDKLSEDKISALQGRINSLELQNAMSGVVRYPLSMTYAYNANPFCGCGCGCNNLV